MSISRLFRRRSGDDLNTEELERGLGEAVMSSITKMPLLERRSDECAANLMSMAAEKAALEVQIEDLQEQLRQINVAIEAERERQRIIEEGMTKRWCEGGPGPIAAIAGELKVPNADDAIAKAE